MTCADCKFFIKTDITQGACRRFPPTMQFVQGPRDNFGRVAVQQMAAQPPVKAESWCGEYKAKLESVD